MGQVTRIAFIHETPKLWEPGRGDKYTYRGTPGVVWMRTNGSEHSERCAWKWDEVCIAGELVGHTSWYDPGDGPLMPWSGTITVTEE